VVFLQVASLDALHFPCIIGAVAVQDNWWVATVLMLGFFCEDHLIAKTNKRDSCVRHWGQGYPETSGNILGTFQSLGQFYCTVTNRHIYGTFGMCF